MRHHAADEVNVTRQPVQLCNNDRAFEAAGLGEGGGELGATIERVISLAGFDIEVLGGDPRRRRTWREPGAALRSPSPDLPCWLGRIADDQLGLVPSPKV